MGFVAQAAFRRVGVGAVRSAWALVGERPTAAASLSPAKPAPGATRSARQEPSAAWGCRAMIITDSIKKEYGQEMVFKRDVVGVGMEFP
eukprot:7457323-Heterocapsa_arctica.AAC.1